MNIKRVAGTFSILALTEKPKLIGVAVASGSTNVGDRVPYAKAGVGAIATQAYTNTIYGSEGLKLLSQGFSPTEALKRLLMEDSERDLRQVAIMNFNGEKAAFTGASVPEYRGEVIGENFIVIGNLLSTKGVVDKMAKNFEGSSGDLALRLVGALKAGVKSGGDKRGERSAALIIASAEKIELEVNVGFSLKPVEELYLKVKSVRKAL
ncbi:MAG: DUF1028 domain-containing protein [Candidatus Bathyarchaeia archaeon]